ncbi:acetate/propionate family kinase [Ferruginibacter sp.]|nr:acetate kinase [Ferruginibacter sp.]
MNIFVINTGSSSLKYQLFKMPLEQPVCSGLVERIGMEDASITHKTFLNGEEKIIKEKKPLPDHEAGLHEVVRLLTDAAIGVIKSTDEIDAVGHRVVHGGESFAATTIITDEVKEKIKALFSLAPLHNPANYIGIQVAEKIFTKAKQVAVFDTAFHQTMPAKAYRFAIPQQLYQEQHIRAYGFHGTSHKYVSEQAAIYLQNKNAKIITIHLGNGSSMTAVDSGQSVDTTMGFGPVGGLIMGTRSGDIDAAVIFHLIEQLGYSAKEVSELLNKKSGMQGLTGLSDMRDIRKAIEEGDEQAELASELYAYRIKKYIGAYAAALNGLDAIVFTAGVGENAADIRRRVCTNMQFLGINLDEAKNDIRSAEIRAINTANSPVKILVIPTNEELEIVKQCYNLLKA